MPKLQQIIICSVVIITLGLLYKYHTSKTKEQTKDEYAPCTVQPHKGYTGLADPASMIICNEALLAAQQEGCNDCVTSAKLCLEKPFTKECSDAIEVCQKTCKNEYASDMASNCHIKGFTDYFPKGGCK